MWGFWGCLRIREHQDRLRVSYKQTWVDFTLANANPLTSHYLNECRMRSGMESQTNGTSTTDRQDTYSRMVEANLEEKDASAGNSIHRRDFVSQLHDSQRQPGVTICSETAMLCIHEEQNKSDGMCHKTQDNMNAMDPQEGQEKGSDAHYETQDSMVDIHDGNTQDAHEKKNTQKTRDAQEQQDLLSTPTSLPSLYSSPSLSSTHTERGAEQDIVHTPLSSACPSRPGTPPLSSKRGLVCETARHPTVSQQDTRKKDAKPRKLIELPPVPPLDLGEALFSAAEDMRWWKWSMSGGEMG